MRTLLTSSLFALSVLACNAPLSPGEDEGATTHSRGRPSTAGRSDESDDETPNAVPPARPRCDAAQTEELQKTLDGAHDPRTDVVMSIKTSCGTRFFTSGPSKFGATRLHRIASITKTYTGAVILRLAEQGKLSLADHVSKWVSNVPYGDRMTVEQLLRHQSGLPNYNAFGDPRLVLGQRFEPEDLLAIANDYPTEFRPGARCKYSNTNFVVLGMIAERAAGKRLEELYRSMIFQPLKLEGTFSSDADFGLSALANGIDENGTVVLPGGTDMSAAWGSGAIAATPDDVALWLDKLGSDFYDDSTKAKAFMLSASDPAEPEARSGLALWSLPLELTDGGGPAFGHRGDISGFHSAAFTYPMKMTTIVVIADADGEDATAILGRVRPIVFGARPAP